MSMPLDWDPTPEKTEKRPPLKVPAPYGVLPYKGARNPMTRSNSAHRVSYAIPTPATQGVPQIYHFESEAEFAVTLEACLDPDLHALEVQLPALRYTWKYNKKGYRDHYFDLRLTFADGYRRAIYVKNGSALKSERVQAEIAAIFDNIPESFADDAIVVNADHFTRPYRDNLRRLWYVMQKHAPDDDIVVEEAARHGNYWLLRDLIRQCDLRPALAWQASMRLIARGVLSVNLHAVTTVHSRVWLAA